MRQTFLFALLLLGQNANARADRVLDNISIQQTTDNKLVAKPALFQYVAKKDAPDVWVVNLGVKLDVLAVINNANASLVELGPFVDYQRNTAADKKQDATKAGLAIDAYSGDLEVNPAVALVSSTLNYVRDGVKDTEGIQAKAGVTPVMKGCAKRIECIWRPNVTTNLVVADFIYWPIVAVEYDQSLKAEMASDEGYVVRVAPRFVAALYLVPSVFKHRVEVIADLTGRQDVIGSLADGWHPLFKLSFNLYAYKNSAKSESAGIGVDYVQGEDPDAKFVHQQLVQISLKVQL